MKGCHENRPEVSVVIPVYNAEKYLRQTMNYLLYQTLEEIEFIFVDDGSSDRSVTIIQEYMEQYKDKIYLYHTDHTGPGGARNKGIEHARADYIGFADADDYMEYDMYEKMLYVAKKENHDLVYTPYYLVRDDKKRIHGRLNQPIEKNQLIFHGEVAFWSKLIHKDLLHQTGKISQIWFEDTAYMLPLFSYAQNPVYLDEPLYFYIKREGSITNSMDDKKTLDTIIAEDYAIKHCKEEYKEAVAARVADRILFNMKTRWIYFDRFVQHLKKYRDILEDDQVLKMYPVRYQKVMNYLEFPEERIPENLFVTDFGHHKEGFDEYKEKAFDDGCKLIILNEENCDISESEQVKQAYKEGNFEYVAHYFVVKNLWLYGGIYLGDGIKIQKPLEFQRCFSSFFGFLDKETFTDRVMGCVKNDPTMKQLWNTYEYPQFYEDTYLPLKERLKNILIAYAGVVMDDQTHLYEYPCAVFQSSVFVAGGRDPMHVCSHDFTKNYKEDGYTVLPDATVESFVDTKTEVPDGVRQELERVTLLKNKLLNQRKELRKEKKKLLKENKRLEEKIGEYENSTSWRVTAIFRKIRQF